MDPGGNKKLKQQIAALRSNNRSAILDTIKDLRTEGDVSILPELFNLLLIQEDSEILGEITALLNDLKEKESAEVIVDAISNPDYEKIQTVLVAACWQNGLSYGKHVSTFVDVVVSGTYSTAIEAFTVIEEAIGELEEEERVALARSLKSKVKQVEDAKKSLFVELVKTIESY
jgi:transcription elongation GreA/GreB family factor